MPWSPGMTSSTSVMNRGYAFRQCLNLYTLFKFYARLTDIAMGSIVGRWRSLQNFQLRKEGVYQIETSIRSFTIFRKKKR